MKHQPLRIFQLKPTGIQAFQWLPTQEGFTYPKWFQDMVEQGRAFTVENSKEMYVRLENKRGKYKGFPGDWICKDQYGHIYIVSEKTFWQRHEERTENREEPKDA